MGNQVKATLYHYGVADDTVHEGSFPELVGFITGPLGMVPLEGLVQAQENFKTDPTGQTMYELDAHRREVYVDPEQFIAYGRDCVDHQYVVVEPVLALVPESPPT